jgi:sodium-dependent phosphate cotransporter
MFFVLPAVVLGLSVAGTITLVVILAPVAIIVTLVVIVSILQRKKPSLLPVVLRNWKFLPLWMRSLEPLDRLISKCACACCKRSTNAADNIQPLANSKSPSGIANQGFE